MPSGSFGYCLSPPYQVFEVVVHSFSWLQIVADSHLIAEVLPNLTSSLFPTSIFVYVCRFTRHGAEIYPNV